MIFFNKVSFIKYLLNIYLIFFKYLTIKHLSIKYLSIKYIFFKYLSIRYLFGKLLNFYQLLEHRAAKKSSLPVFETFKLIVYSKSNLNKSRMGRREVGGRGIIKEEGVVLEKRRRVEENSRG